MFDIIVGNSAGFVYRFPLFTLPLHDLSFQQLAHNLTKLYYYCNNLVIEFDKCIMLYI
jgi:hypothetical protein